MQSLVCIPFAIASQTKATKSPLLITGFELRAYRYQLPVRLGEFKTEFGVNLVASSDLDIFLTRPSEFGVEFQVFGVLQPRQNNVQFFSEFALDSSYKIIVPHFAFIVFAMQVEWSRYRANSVFTFQNVPYFTDNESIESNRYGVKSLSASFVVETSVIENRVLPRNNALTPTTEFSIIATRKQI